MLTPERIKQLDAIAGVDTPTPTGPTNSNIEAGKKWAAELETRWSESRKNERKINRSIGEKILDFTGGKEIGQGLGQGLAQKKTSKELDKSLNDAINQQHELLKKRKEIKDLGGDITAIDKAIQLNTDNLTSIGGTADLLLNPNELTNKQVVGDALQLGTTVGSVGSLGAGTPYEGVLGKVPGLTKGAPAAVDAVTKSVGVLKGAGMGALKGAGVGAGFGALQGTAQGLQEDKSAREIANEGIKGALLGGTAGAVLGGVTGGISGGIKAKALRKQNFTEDLVTPELNKKATETAIKTGKVTESTGITGKRGFTEAIPNIKEIKASVDKVPGISMKNTHLENVNAIHEEIGKQAEVLKSSLKGKGFFSPSEFKGYMTQVKSELADNPILVGDAEKTADKILNKFDSLIEQKGYTPEGLLEARKGLDKWMIAQKGEGVLDPAKENAISVALRAIRQGGNDFLASRVKDVAVKESLKHQSNLYQAIENIAPKAAKEGGSWLKRFFATPKGKITKVVGIAAGSAFVGSKIAHAAGQ